MQHRDSELQFCYKVYYHQITVNSFLSKVFTGICVGHCQVGEWDNYLLIRARPTLKVLAHQADGKELLAMKAD